MSKRKKKGRGIQHRVRKWKKRDRDEVERLIELAAEPVPTGSGAETFGRGAYCYVKLSNADFESTRVFRFRKQADAQRALRAGVRADAIAEGREHELEEILLDFVAIP